MLRRLVLWASQPQEFAGIDWTHPAARGLVGAWVPTQGPGNLAITGGSRLFVPTSVEASGANLAGRYSGQISSDSAVTNAAALGFAIGLRTGTAAVQSVVLSRGSGSAQFGFHASHSNSSYAGAVYSGAGFTIIGKPTGAALADNTRYDIGARIAASNGAVYSGGVKTATNASAAAPGTSSAGLYFASDSAGGNSWTAGPWIEYLFIWNIAPEDWVFKEVAANPWQIFEPQRIWVPVSVGGGSSWSASITESASASDAATATLDAVAALTEAAGASDSATAAAVLLAAVSEAASALEAVVAAAIWNRTQADAVTSADSSTASLAGATSVIEAASASDLLTAAAVLVASLTEAAAPAELLSTGSIYTATQADAAAAADALSAAAALVAAVSESAALADNASGVAQLVALITEQAVLADALVGTYPVTRNVSVAELVAALDLLSSSFAAIASGASWRFSVAATRRAFKVPTTGRAFAVRFTAAAVSMPPIQGTTMTCEKPQVIGPLFVGETVTASFEFARQTSAPSAPSVDVVRYSGADDPTPAALKSGAASVSGTQVLQHLTGAVAGVTYLLTAWATAPDGNRYAARQALLEVRAPS